MKIKDLIKDSVLGIIGYVDEYHLNTLEIYINQNRFFYDQFPYFLVLYIADTEENFDKAELIWKKWFGEKALVVWRSINRGHTFGTMDLDNDIINFLKPHNKKYIFKSTSDIIFFPNFLELKISESDFYYMNGIGWSTTQDHTLEYCLHWHFFPQTNFYIINSNIDFINPKNEIDEIYELQKQRPELRPWELKQGFECETFLKRCIERNNLGKHHLIPHNKYHDLIQLIIKYGIHDSSHKNIMAEEVGVCHYHDINHKIILI